MENPFLWRQRGWDTETRHPVPSWMTSERDAEIRILEILSDDGYHCEIEYLCISQHVVMSPFSYSFFLPHRKSALCFDGKLFFFFHAWQNFSMKGCLKLSQISKLLFPLKLFNKVECILHFLLVFIDILFFHSGWRLPVSREGRRDFCITMWQEVVIPAPLPLFCAFVPNLIW